MKRVVVTGASGYICGRMLDELRARYELVLLDATATDRTGAVVPDVRIVDLLGLDRDRYREHFRGADAVLHLAYLRGDVDEDVERRFRRELDNVLLAYNVYAAAVDEGVRRVVAASSNHAVDWYERLWSRRTHDVVDACQPARSDNFYGWSKGAYEELGFVFATGREHGRALEVVQLRIGGPRETDVEQCPPGDLACVRRALAVYLSVRDQVQLVTRSLETPDLRDADGVPFQVFFGISGNWTAFWSLANARRVIGYEPQDVAEVRFAEEIAQHVEAVSPE